MTGATGLLGRSLARLLHEGGHSMSILAREPAAARAMFPFAEDIGRWTAEEPVPIAQLQNIDAVIHLAGEPIFGRWTAAKKKRIADSRIEGTKCLIAAVNGGAPIRTVVSASAVGFYGDRGDTKLTEEAGPGGDFLARVCASWESEARSAHVGVRSVQLRLGAVLSQNGGLIGKLAPLFARGLGGPIGDGRQYMSWIHIEDAARLFVHALVQEKLTGAVNAASPDSVTNAAFSRALARRFGKSAPFKVPKVLIRIAMGELADAVSASQRVEPVKARASGFEFQFPDLESALEDLIIPQQSLSARSNESAGNGRGG